MSPDAPPADAETRPLLDGLAAFLDVALHRISGKTDMAAAIRYSRWRWTALFRYLRDVLKRIADLPKKLQELDGFLLGEAAGDEDEADRQPEPAAV
jgi:hypothetical protein